MIFFGFRVVRRLRPRCSLRARWLGLVLVWTASQVHAQPVPDERVREHTRTILQRSEFRELGQEREPWRAWAWVEQLLRSQERLDAVPPDAARFQLPLPPRAVVIVSGVLLLIVLVQLWRHARRDLSAAELPPGVQRMAADVPLPVDSPPLTAADGLARAGDYAGALRALHAAALRTLGRTRALRLHHAHTNGEYTAALAPPPARDAFQALTVLFERSFYGAQPAQQIDYEQACQLTAQLLPADREPTP